MIKVLNVLETLERGGIETFILNNHSNMDCKNIHYDYLIMRESKYQSLKNQVEESGSKVFIYHSKPIKLWNHVYNIYQTLRNYGPYDVVQTHWCEFNGLVLFLAYLMGTKKRFSFVHLISLPSKNFFKKAYRFIFKCLISIFATKKFACSKMAAKSVYLGKFTVLNNAIDLEKFKFNPSVRAAQREKLNINNKFTIVHTARFYPEKNQQFALQVLKRLLSICPAAHLIFCGDGPNLKTIKRQAAELQIYDNISFLGSVQNVNEILQAADSFILPSTWEALGLSAIEAQGAGLPCVLANNIPTEAFVVNAYPLPLSAGAEAWAEKIFSFISFKREDCSSEIKKAGFDIKDTAKMLEQEYLK